MARIRKWPTRPEWASGWMPEANDLPDLFKAFNTPVQVTLTLFRSATSPYNLQVKHQEICKISADRYGR